MSSARDQNSQINSAHKIHYKTILCEHTFLRQYVEETDVYENISILHKVKCVGDSTCQVIREVVTVSETQGSREEEVANSPISEDEEGKTEDLCALRGGVSGQPTVLLTLVIYML